MRIRLIGCVAGFVVSLATLTPSVRAQHENVGEAISDLPDVVLWHWKTFYLLPHNLESFNRAYNAARASLKPGQEREYFVLMRMGPDGEPLVFHDLAPADPVPLLSGEVRIVERIKIRSERYAFISPLRALSKTDFQKIAGEHPGLGKSYEDHVFAISAFNGFVGFTRGLPAIDSDAKKWVVPSEQWIDLASTRCCSGAAGTVILCANASEETYTAWNTRTKQAEQHKRGAKLKDFGTTAWVLAKTPDGREYVVVHRGLATLTAKAGDAVTAGQQLGEYRSPEETKGGVAIWRVDGPSQYFLNKGDRPSAPARVWPPEFEKEVEKKIDAPAKPGKPKP